MVEVAVGMMCAVASGLCAAFLFRGYHQTGTTPLAWAAVCFCVLALENVLLAFNLAVAPALDLRPFRYVLGFVGPALFFAYLAKEAA